MALASVSCRPSASLLAGVLARRPAGEPTHEASESSNRCILLLSRISVAMPGVKVTVAVSVCGPGWVPGAKQGRAGVGARVRVRGSLILSLALPKPQPDRERQVNVGTGSKDRKWLLRTDRLHCFELVRVTDQVPPMSDAHASLHTIVVTLTRHVREPKVPSIA